MRVKEENGEISSLFSENQLVRNRYYVTSTHLEEVINCIPKLASWWRVDFPNVSERTTTKLSQQLQDMRSSAHYLVLLL
ncbi:hypothetical protein T01_932 [Trichinella spiralis]|uniref:Uncharacterized protein n=1 Tax=Trichinella spiralis TaxID=6334 RepID=A0A0V1AWR4_TRISP|nr:hypothetical protein T01_932 [Trichinella spiralis]